MLIYFYNFLQYSDKEKILGGFQRLPSIGSAKKRGTPGSAKEHYLQKARYYPGAPNAPIKPNIEGRVVDAGSGRKFVEFTSGNVQSNNTNNSRYLGEMNQGTKLPNIKKKESTDRLAGTFSFFSMTLLLILRRFPVYVSILFTIHDLTIIHNAYQVFLFAPCPRNTQKLREL